MRDDWVQRQLRKDTHSIYTKRHSPSIDRSLITATQIRHITISKHTVFTRTEWNVMIHNACSWLDMTQRIDVTSVLLCRHVATRESTRSVVCWVQNTLERSQMDSVSHCCCKRCRQSCENLVKDRHINGLQWLMLQLHNTCKKLLSTTLAVPGLIKFI